MFKVPLALISVAVYLALSACSSPRLQSRVTSDQGETTATVSNGRSGAVGKNAGPMVTGGAADADRRAAEQAAQVVLRRANKPWVASVSVPMGTGEKLPSVFQEPVRLNFDDTRSGGKVSLRLVAERITAATGVPVRIKPDVYASSTQAMPVSAPPSAGMPPPPLPGLPGGPGAAPAGPPAGALGFSGVPLSPHKDATVDSVSMRWDGSLEGYLNHITDLTSLSWEYREGVVVIERLRTEFFEIASIDGETSYSMGLSATEQGSGGSGGSGGGSGAAGGSALTDVSEKGKSNGVATILATVSQIIKDVPGSNAVRSEGSGRIAVTTTKEAMSKVRAFVRAENESILRQAQIQFDIYSVRSKEGDERGVDWSVVLTSLSDALALKFQSPKSLVNSDAGGLGFSVLAPTDPNAPPRFADTKAMLKFLSQQGVATQHRPVSLLTLNRQWARKASLGTQGYISETTPGAASSVGGLGGAPGIKTGTITTGDRYLALPYIMDNNTVVLKFGIGLSSLVNLETLLASGNVENGQKIQIPQTTNIIDQSTVALKTGQVLVITGLSRIITNDDKQTLTEDAPLATGGSKVLRREREDFIIFVRPTIL